MVKRLSYSEFKKLCDDTRSELIKYPHLRIGQAYMINLCKINEPLYLEITGSEYDPFNRKDRLASFFIEIIDMMAYEYLQQELQYLDFQKLFLKPSEASMEEAYDDTFNETEWLFERSSGYAGERNIRTNEWINSAEFDKRKCKAKEDALWEDTVFRIIKLHTRSNNLTEAIVNELKENIQIYGINGK